MSDYDNKDIPTLDDIIDDDRTNIADIDDSVTTEQTKRDQPESEHAFNEQQSNVLAEIDDDTTRDTDENLNRDKIKSHQFSTQSHIALQITYQENYNKLTSPSDESSHEPRHEQKQRVETEQNTIEPASLVSIAPEPILLDPIVDAVATRIMPELEQQLKHLIKQALEENLPEAAINSTDVDQTK